MQLTVTFLLFAALVASACCQRISVFAEFRRLQSQIDELKSQVAGLLRTQIQGNRCDPKTTSPMLSKDEMQATTVHYASCLLTQSGHTDRVGRVDVREESGSNNLQINLQVTGSSLGLQPNSKHGFHVHTYGNITGSCSNTGGHYNPDGVNHAGPTDSSRHVGDLGNVLTESSGDINVGFNDSYASLVGNKAIIGRAFVLHSGEDDVGKGGNPGSLASGNAGSRLACCVIGWASGTEWVN